MEVKYLISQDVDPYINLASEAELMSHVEPNIVILFLWQNKNTIVIGRNQRVDAECKVEEFLQNGGLIARRRSGGGAVYHDLGNLNYSIICKSNVAKQYAYHQIVIKALSGYGLKAEFNGRNDILLGDKKVSGNATYDDGDVVCQHGTILIDSSIETMKRFLTPDTSKLERNHVSSVESRVTNLAEVLKTITVENMKRALIKAMCATPFEYDENKAIKGKYVALFSSNKWIYRGMK